MSQTITLALNMVLCHCGKQHRNLDACPYCYCRRGDRTCARKVAAPVPVYVPLTKEQQIARMIQMGSIVRGCKGCEPMLENPDAMCPSHTASDRCRSGKRPHCTCDTCF